MASKAKKKRLPPCHFHQNQCLCLSQSTADEMKKRGRLHHHPGVDLQPLSHSSKLSRATVNSKPASCQVSDMPTRFLRGRAMVLKSLPAVEGRLLTETASLCCRLATGAPLASVELLTATDQSQQRSVLCYFPSNM